MPSKAVAKHEFETVTQLLASAASYAESVNEQPDRNTVAIDRLTESVESNARAIALHPCLLYFRISYGRTLA